MSQCTTNNGCTGLATASAPREFRPHVESRETPEALILEIDLPGATEDNVNLELDAGVLTVTAPRAASQGPQEAPLSWGEIESGVFKRSFGLPEGLDPESIEASLEFGVLKISFRKRASVAPRKIEVRGS